MPSRISIGRLYRGMRAAPSGALRRCSYGTIRSAAGYALVLVAIAAGCGKRFEPDRVAVYPVEGRIEFNGKPTPGAFVVLHPKSGGMPARGQVTEDGTFRVTTYDAGDGAVPGEYLVTVEWRKLVKRDGDFTPGPNQLPPKYANPQTSQIVVQVAEHPNQLPPITLRR